MDKAQQIREQIITYLVQEQGLEADQVVKSQNLYSDGLLDSLMVLSIIEFIENQFDMKLNPFDLSIDQFNSVDNIAGFVSSRQ